MKEINERLEMLVTILNDDIRIGDTANSLSLLKEIESLLTAKEILSK